MNCPPGTQGQTFTLQQHTHTAVKSQFYHQRSAPAGKRLTPCKWILPGYQGAGPGQHMAEANTEKHCGRNAGFPLKYIIMEAQLCYITVTNYITVLLLCVSLNAANIHYMLWEPFPFLRQV